MKSDAPNYFAIIPAKVRYDHDLSANTKLLYGELTALSSAKGYAWPRNKYFAKLYGVTKRTIRRWISTLESKEYIRIEHVEQEYGTKRLIYLVDEIGPDKNVMGGGHNCPEGEDKKSNNLEDNNVRHNSTSVNKINRKEKPTTTDLQIDEGELNEVISYWERTFDTAVDLNDKDLKQAVIHAIQKYSVEKIKKAIKQRSRADYYKNEVFYLRDKPKSFFENPPTIENDLKRRSYKLISYDKKCEMEIGGTNKRFEIDNEERCSKGNKMWRVYG